VHGIYAKNGLTIAGDVAVKVNVKGQGNLYGICYEYSSSACTGIAVKDKATLDVSIEVVGETEYAGYGVYCEFNQYNDTEKGVSFSGSGAKTVTVKSNYYAVGIYGQHVDISGEGKVTVDLQSAPSGTGIYASHCANMDNAEVEVKNALEGIAGYGKYRSASNCSQSGYKILVKNSTVKITSAVAASKGLYCNRYAGAGIFCIENSTVTIDTKGACVDGSGTAWEVYGKSVVDLTSANASVIYTPDYSVSKFALSDGGSVTIKSTQSTRAVWSNSVVTLEENTRLVEGTPYKSSGETKYYSIEGEPSVLKFAYSTTKTTATIAGGDGSLTMTGKGKIHGKVFQRDIFAVLQDKREHPVAEQKVRSVAVHRQVFTAEQGKDHPLFPRCVVGGEEKGNVGALLVKAVFSRLKAQKRFLARCRELPDSVRDPWGGVFAVCGNGDRLHGKILRFVINGQRGCPDAGLNSIGTAP